ncbi:uncharacterized protein DMAD_04146 [Drosophila madeirensis]|uniref:Uncharacterized protein n=1 Tax=Drosophila madeirensis TaxID=30013 RepID=A0AAU9GBC4_DROMD
MRNFLIFTALLDVLQLQCMAFSFSNLHALFDKLIEEGTRALQSSHETTPEAKNEIVMLEILLQLCQIEQKNRKKEVAHNTNINNNINNINNVIESPKLQQPPVTIIIMNKNQRLIPPYQRRGKVHVLRRKYRWQREYRFVIENNNNNSSNVPKIIRNSRGKPGRRVQNRSNQLSVRTNNTNLDSDVKECIRVKVKELEKR